MHIISDIALRVQKAAHLPEQPESEYQRGGNIERAKENEKTDQRFDIGAWPQQNIRANHRRTNAAQTDQRGGAAGIGKPMSERTNGTGNHGKNDKFGAPNLSFLP